jgi:regulator of replication initiation timing
MSEEQINKLGETAVELAEENHTLRSLNETLLSRLRSAEVALQDRADHFEENQRLLLRLHTLRDAVRPLMAYPGLMEYVGTEIFQKAMQALHEATPTAKPSPVETQDD